MNPLRPMWLVILLGLALGGQYSVVSVTRLIVQGEVLWRVPVIAPHDAPTIRWGSRKGPKCVATEMLAAAALADDNSVDFLLRDRRRMRAQLDSDCPTLDFYGGFYLQSDDAQVCAKRDEIRNRMGASCRINQFRLMVPSVR